MGSKKVEEITEGAPLWMVTYGDMMTLLLCFFVLLLSFSSVQQSDFNKAMGSLKGYLGVLVSRNMGILSPNYNFTEAVMRLHPSNLKEDAEQKEQINESYLITLAEEMKKDAEKKGIGGDIEIINIYNTLRIRMPVAVIFSQGELKFNKSARGFLNKIVSLLKDIPYDIEVEGHTDNVPIFSEKYESNWELSSQRAIMVLRYLIDKGIDQKRLSAIACGEFHPIADNNTEEGRRKNRRVEIVIGTKLAKSK